MTMQRQTCRLDSLQAQRELAGYTIQRLARESLTSDLAIAVLEQKPRGGTCLQAEADRIATALGVTLEALGCALL
jgi:hypothetical protein